MASVTMTAASFLGGAIVSGGSPATTHRRFVIANSAKSDTVGERVVIKMSSQESKGTHDSNSGRRDLSLRQLPLPCAQLPAVAVAVEPKRGSPEAKKIYAPVCVTMPTARICHK